MIKLKHVSKRFLTGKTTTQAVKNVSFDIKAGEFIALVGPSGSGKSTLLHLIGGLDTPSEGEIYFNNTNLNLLSDKELSIYRNKHIGFIFQEFHLENFLSVRQNVMLPTFFQKGKFKEPDRAERLLSEVGLLGKIKSKITELSGGQKQRTAIARALILKPKLIVADEPTGNLDLKTGSIIIDLLKKLHKKNNTTLIIATHDDNIAKAADRIIKIQDGHLIEENK